VGTHVVIEKLTAFTAISYFIYLYMLPLCPCLVLLFIPLHILTHLPPHASLQNFLLLLLFLSIYVKKAGRLTLCCKNKKDP
jgi:4-amino-4-deoxy-L-arabinose transferase-like glycosyltransferase